MAEAAGIEIASATVLSWHSTFSRNRRQPTVCCHVYLESVTVAKMRFLVAQLVMAVCCASLAYAAEDGNNISFISPTSSDGAYVTDRTLAHPR